ITGGNWTSIGELSALLGNTHNIPLVKIDARAAERVDLSRYTSIVLSGGQLSPELSEKLSKWVDAGGTLIALSGAAQWAASLANPAPEGSAGGRGNRGRAAAPDTSVSRNG